MFRIVYHPDAAQELETLRPFDRARILNAIKEHLSREPLKMEGQRKRLELDEGGEIYQLRVGEFRVFYNVEEDEERVVVQHVRFKGRRRTEEIL